MRSKALGPRQFCLLETLLEQKFPIQRIDLFRVLSEKVDFWKESGENFWIEDFSHFMKNLVRRGLVDSAKDNRNRVFYCITRRGEDLYIAHINPKEFKERMKRRLRQLKPSASEKLEEAEKAFTKPELYKIYEELVISRRFWKRNETLARMRILGFDTSSIEAKLHEEELQELKQRAVVSREPLGNCYFCGSAIYNKEAADSARLLEKFTGAKTGMVCCSCFRHLEWIEKYLTGK